MKLSNNESGYILTTNSYEGPTHWDNDGALLAWQQAILLVNEFWVSIKHCPDLTCCEVVIGEYRFKVCVGMPENIFAYMDYVEPKEEPAPPVEYQYINRRISDGALWPTFCPITSPGWEQINVHPIEGRHEEGDTVLFYDRFPVPPDKMERHTVKKINKKEGRIYAQGYSIRQELLINFSKGDHLSESEVAAYYAHAIGYEDQIMSQFK